MEFWLKLEDQYLSSTTYLYIVSSIFSPTAQALGSSAMVKVSEQAGAAPNRFPHIPPRFQGKGSQVQVLKPRFPSIPRKSIQVKVPK